MKRLFFSLSLTLLSLTACAAGQGGDIIYIDGEPWVLLGNPVYSDSELRHDLKAALPKERSITTSNWAGYTAYWSIRKEMLCLDSVKYEIYDKATDKSRTMCVSSSILNRVFKKYLDGKRIVATWFSKDIRAASGKLIYRQYEGLDENFENEQVIRFDHGKVTGSKVYHNYSVDGFSFDQKDSEDFKVLFPSKSLKIKNYPELAGTSRIVFTVRRARVDATGNLVECELKVLKPGDNPKLAEEMAALLKSHRPWRVLYVNGEFSAKGIEGYSFTYRLDGK